MIELCKVRLSRGGTTLLDAAFVCIEESQVVLVSGPSGIGKTSLLSLIGGFLTADEGEVRVFDHDVARMRATSTALLRRKLAFVPQELELIGDYSALANVRLALQVCGASRRESRERAIVALEAVDMGDCLKRRVDSLSTGQRRRISLARGLVRNAKIFIADEPTGDLDAQRVLKLVGIIEEMRESQAAIVITSNDPRLLIHAQQRGWRHLAISCAQLVPGDMSSLLESAKNSSSENASLGESSEKLGEPSNLVQFPLGAKL